MWKGILLWSYYVCVCVCVFDYYVSLLFLKFVEINLYCIKTIYIVFK